MQGPGAMAAAATLLSSTMVVSCVQAEELGDIRDVQADLHTPAMSAEEPGPGRRVRDTLPGLEGTGLYHVLYLLTDWTPGARYPVIVEYPGNGPYRNGHGDVCTGRPEHCNLGYGISGGTGFVWVCLSFVSDGGEEVQLQWWGDAEASVRYCKRVVDRVCRAFGGDRGAVILAGFSRGAIACNYMGLRDDSIAGLWLAFVAHSHYDGVRVWPYADSDRRSALRRLVRLRGRPQFISHEGSVAATQEYVLGTGVEAPFTFVPLPYRNHTDTWVLRDVPERRRLREWLRSVLEGREGAPAGDGAP